MENKIILIDESGAEVNFNIVLTFEHPETQANYVVVEKENSDEGLVYAYRYDEENNLFPIESDEEWKIVEEVLDSFYEADDEETA